MQTKESPMINIDDRMEVALSLIDAALSRVGLLMVSDAERDIFRDRYSYRSLLGQIFDVTGADLSEARALLDEWHVWHRR